MKKIKGFFIITLLLSLLLSFSAFAIDLPEPTSNFFVNDFADVIDSEAEDELTAIGASLYKQTTAQVVVVTVDSLDGYEVGEYALELGREWGVGSEETDNGVVLLMSVSDRQVTIQVGYGLEGCLPDGKTGRILDTYAIPYLSENDFSTGLTEAYKAIVSVVCKEYGVDLNLGTEYIENIETNEELDTFTIIAYIVFTIVVLLVLIFGKGRTRVRRSFGGFGGGHYGGFNGGSGGSSRGGGGGGFRGGGGSFGGGGASRGF